MKYQLQGLQNILMLTALQRLRDDYDKKLILILIIQIDKSKCSSLVQHDI